MMQFQVAELKTRLDKFLVTQLPGVSRSAIQKNIELGAVTVNGAYKNEAKFVVRSGDVVGYDEALDKTHTLAAPTSRVKLVTLYDSNGLLIIDKPPGLSVHPGAGVKGDSLSDLLLYQFPDIAGVGEAHRPGIVHRLDKDTSGVMLVAKTMEMYEYLKDAFAARKVKKEYLALVRGVPEKAHGFIDVPIGKSKTDFRKYAAKNVLEAKPSLTEYRVKEVLTSPDGVDKMGLISVNLHTGRTHQIRVHMAFIGHPLIGDALYGGKSCHMAGLTRQFLHARKIEVRLPDETWIEAESPVPDDLRSVLATCGSKIVQNL
jgi:23S rRNA pseudouridine1911/1915/1917 synthase